MIEDYVSTIEIFNRPNVYIKDRARVNNLLNEIVGGGFDNLQIISDFDQTLTKQHENGKDCLSSFNVFKSCPSLPREYVEVNDFLLRKYIPIEHDLSLPIEERRKSMNEWYQNKEKTLRGIKMSPQEIIDTAIQLGPSLRDKSRKVFEFLEEKKIPISVFSAGLGNTVEAILKHNGVMSPNLKVVSNFLKFDENNIIQGFQDKFIHIYSKNGQALEGTDHFKLISKRTNIILIGDSVGDSEMADGLLNTNAVLKICFLYKEPEEKLLNYLNFFDIVLNDDQTIDILASILECLER